MRQADALPAILVAGHLRDNLGSDVAGGGKAVRLFDEGAGDDGAVLQHVLQIDQIAVVHMLREIVGIVEVDNSLLMRFHNFLRQQHAAGDILGNLAGHIVALHAVDRGVFVGVFLFGLFVVALDEAEDLVVGGVGPAGKRTGIAVFDIPLGHLKSALLHDLVLDQILYLLNRRRTPHFQAARLHAGRDIPDLVTGQLTMLFVRIVGLGDRHNDFAYVKRRLGTVSLDDFHTPTALSILYFRRPFSSLPDCSILFFF